MLPKPIVELSFNDVAALVQAGLREGRTLDFKLAAAGAKDEDKREFLADVSALANTAGGDILFGIEESQGEAVSVPGIELADPDHEVLRLLNTLRTGLEPRLPKVDVRWLPGTTGKGVLIVRTPRSYLAPHRVTLRGHGHFYGRNNAGKTSLDVTELRAAFLATEGLHQRVRRFRNERLGIIEGGEGPVVLRSGAKAILHVIPLESFTAERDIGINPQNDLLMPIGSSSGMNVMHTLEGYASFTGREDIEDGVFNYALLFRSGVIESGSTVGYRKDDGAHIPASAVEWKVLQALEHYRRKLTSKGVELPLYVFLSIIGVRGHYLATGRHPFGLRRPLRTDAMLLPEAIITDAAQTGEEVMRPVFDRFWNAFGYERSLSFDPAGKYVGERY